MTPSVPALVYLLCLATSATCAFLLVRAYLQSRTALLLWSGLCFVLLALNNLFVVLDIVVLPTHNLTPWRQGTSLLAVAVLLYGFIWEAE